MLDFEFDYNDESVSEPRRESFTEELLQPLYSGAPITVYATYCAIMEFACSCSLPYSSIEKLVKLLRLLCPPGSKLPPSFYVLKQFFKKFTTGHKKTEFCAECGQELGEDRNCPDSDCTGDGGVNYLI